MSIIDEIKNTPKEKRYGLFCHLMQMRSRELQKPITAYFELTPVCNFGCKMCYSRLTQHEVNANGGLIASHQWVEYAKEAANLGVLYISLTGGECMLHPEFVQIYKSIYELGFRIAIFTNGTTLTDEIIQLFKKNPPYSVSLTMYGFSDETYMRTCGVKGAFDIVKRNIEIIRNLGIEILIKCTLTEDMIGDFKEIYLYAKERGMPFIYNNTLMKNREACKRDCDSTQVRDDKFVNTLKMIVNSTGQEYYDVEKVKISENVKVVEKGMLCGAGTSVFAINWRGEIIPCITCDIYSKKLSNKPNCIIEEWEGIVKWSKSFPQIVECQLCEYKHKCRQCVVIHYADTHEFGRPSPRLCYKVQHGIKD